MFFPGKYGFYAFILIVVTLFAGCSGAPRPKPPNILFIMSDDHGYQAISAYDTSLIKTPNIDRLATEGVRFTKSFVTNSICAPSRAVMLTGTYNNINGVINNSVVFDTSQMIYPKLLKKAGYQTALFGKWHLKSTPSGFDYWSILPGQGDYYNPGFITMGKRVRKKGYVTDIIADEFINWMEHRDKRRPFCVLVHNKAPHRNWMPDLKHLEMFENENIPVPETFFDDYDSRSAAAKEQRMSIARDMYFDYDLKYDNYGRNPGLHYLKNAWKRIYGRLNSEEKRIWDSVYDLRNSEFEKLNPEGKELAIWKYERYMKDYLRCIASVDENVGRILDYLDENGLADNTIVVYTSDQGFYLGEHGWFDKRFMYEQSFRTPLIIRYPGKLKPHIDTTHLVLNLDYAPTLLDFAGVQIPAFMQGLSMKKILETPSSGYFRDAVYYHYYEYPNEHMVKRHYGIRTGRYKLIHYYYDIDAWELYDLQNDPHELNNLYGNEEYDGITASLKARLDELRNQYGDIDEVKYLPKPAVVINHLAKGAEVIYSKAYSPEYTGGGNDALVDGICSPDDVIPPVNYNIWQGFHGNDLELVIDLKRMHKVKAIYAGFLQNQTNWIFLPERVTLMISDDNLTYDTVFTVNENSTKQDVDVFKKIYGKPVKPVNARYIKVVAKNAGVCPEWHSGAGKKAWLFCDEIIVK